MGVALATLIYTALGGLRASLETDRWQAWLLLVLLLIVGAFALHALPSPLPRELPSAPVGTSLSVALTLVIAVTAANLFHQGYWQRVWSAQSDAALRQGALLGGGATVVVVLAVGGLGMLAAASGLAMGNPPVPFFALLNGAPAWVALAALILAVVLVASSVDTLQVGIASMVLTGRQGASLSTARWITVILMLPVVVIALEGISVLRLFLIADLLCATAVVPLLLGLWRRMTALAAIGGCMGGLVGAIAPGWMETGTLNGGLMAASFPGSIPTLAPFLGALIASTAVSLALVALRPGPAEK